MYPERIKQYLPRLRRNADRLWVLTSNLLDATKIDTGTLKLNITDFNLINLVRDITRDMRRRSFITDKNTDTARTKPKIELSIASKKIIVHGDKDRTAQVLSNLLNNANKFMSSGIITITINQDGNDFVKISIKDTGKGIDAEIKPKLFGRFITNSDNGTGLGLFISKNIVQAQGGIISGDNNKVGPGATFSFTLPITKNKIMS
jgi:signal transduction histidine kinase